MTRAVFTGARLFDGERLHDGIAVVVEAGRIAQLLPEPDAPPGGRVTLAGGILAPGLIDLQVNGGDGIMLNDAPSVEGIARICATHARLGATGILPTLITDTPAVTRAVIAAGIAAAQDGVAGFLGLHLEGPHFDIRRKGTHDPALIRPMTANDLALLLEAAEGLPALMVTLAPEAVTPAQIETLARAGVVVSLGHSDCSFAQAKAAFSAGAACVTHLFNAMSPLGHREPGLVGAALDGPVAAGLIADGVHVAPQVIRIALAAKPQGMFLVSDAMAVAGTDLPGFRLQGRRISRAAGRLTLADGTLAGADCDLPQCLRLLAGAVGLGAGAALAMATSVPAGIIRAAAGRLLPGRVADMVHLTDDLRLNRVWRAGQPFSP